MYHASSGRSLLVTRDLRCWRVAAELLMRRPQRTSLHWREAHLQAQLPGQTHRLAPLAQSAEHIHGKDGLRQVHASNPRRGGDNVKERAGGTGRSACAPYSASLRAPDRNLVLSALRACSARSTTDK